MIKSLNKQEKKHSNSSNGKICITAQGDSLKSEIDPHFGRAAYFLIINQDLSNFEAIRNSSNEQAHGAGIQSAQLLIDKGVSVLITGQVGPNAQKVLESSQIKIITGARGSAEQALARFKKQVK